MGRFRLKFSGKVRLGKLAQLRSDQIFVVILVSIWMQED